MMLRTVGNSSEPLNQYVESTSVMDAKAMSVTGSLALSSTSLASTTAAVALILFGVSAWIFGWVS